MRMIDKTYWLDREVSISLSGWKLSANDFSHIALHKI
jgi:hypothetical protein